MDCKHTLRNLQQSMHRFLLNGEGDALSLVAEQPPLPAPARLAIYTNAYRIRLHQALETDHEMLAWYLGDEQFAAMAMAYIDTHPSSFRSLRDFGTALPAFLREHDPYAQMPAVSELAAFERRMLDVFDAPDAARADRGDLQAVSPERWPDMRLRFHPSVHLHLTHTNAVEIWQALKASSTPPPPDTTQAGAWLIWRGTDRLSQFRPLTATEDTLLQAAVHGSDFALLCEALIPILPESEISETLLSHLLDWLDQGLIRQLDC